MLFLGAAVVFAQYDLKTAKKTRTLDKPRSAATTLRMTTADEVQLPPGEMKVILEEDFSKFPDGSEALPTAVPTDQHGTISPDCTLSPDWMGYPIYSVGGAALLGIDGNGETGLLISPILTNTYGGTLTMKAKLLAESGTTDVVVVEYNDADFTDNISYSQTEVNADDWVTITMPLQAYGYGTYLCLYALAQKLIVDDIKVEAYRPYVETPKAMPFSDYTGTGFTAHWTEAEGATAYLLSVYSVGEGNTSLYVCEDKEVEGTSHALTGLDPETIYYYYVKGTNGTHASMASNVVMVEALLTPVFNEPVAAEGGFDVTWNDVEDADFYDFWAYRHHAAETNEEVFVIHQDFAALKSTGTLENPEIDGELYNYVPTLPGWILWGSAYIDGAVGLNGGASLNGMPCYLETPLFDLSDVDGKITVEADFCTNNPGEGDLMVYMFRQEGDELFNGGYQELSGVNGEWQHARFTVDGGSWNCKLIFAPTGSGCVFIDNLKLSVELETGEHFLIPVLNAVTNEPKAFVPVTDTNAPYACKVRAIGSSNSGSGLIYSGFTSLKYFGNTTSIHSVKTAKPVVSVSGNTLSVSTQQVQPISVYTLSGTLVAKATAASAHITLPARGVYIVSVGGKTMKVVAPMR